MSGWSSVHFRLAVALACACFEGFFGGGVLRYILKVRTRIVVARSGVLTCEISLVAAFG